MKVAVLNNWVPFQRGGAEHLAETLVRELEVHGHTAELFRVPFRWDAPAHVQESMLSAALLQVEGADRLIGLKFPAYLVPHPDQVVWLIHQFRQVYDLWDDGNADPDWRALKRSVTAADRLALGSVRSTYCISEAVAQRLRTNNGLHAQVLRHPLAEPGQFRCDDYGDYLFAAGRINGAKRQLLALQAMRHTRSDVRLVVAGPPETPADLAVLEEEIRRHGLEDRVTLVPEFVSEQRKVELYAGALGVVYVPYEEDSYGYVTAEAMLSRKPVVTTTDSGDLRVLVADGETGLVVAPEPEELAAAFDLLAGQPALARRLGESARDAVEALDLSWERVVTALTAP